MFDRIRNRVLHWLKVPPDPEPPAGAPGSLRVFRAGRNFYKLRLLRWGLGQTGALIGIVFSVVFLDRLESGYQDARTNLARPTAVAPAAPTPTPVTSAPRPNLGEATPPAATVGQKLPPAIPKRARTSVARAVEHWPWWLFPLLKFLEFAGIVTYLAQIPFTYALVRLDYELRWYLVTDRSLRIRAGITTVQESTMSFANVQQVVVTQGPLQGLLGLADVRVQSAGGGGGGGDHQQKGGGDSLHTGVFHGVDNANEIRDLVLERLRQFRESGLGDPEESTRHAPPATPASATGHPALAAARELLEEARALRRALR